MKKRASGVDDHRVLIVSNTRAQAELWARAEHLPQAAWVWAVGDTSRLHGWVPSRIIYCGDWWEHPGWPELRKELDIVEARMEATYEK